MEMDRMIILVTTMANHPNIAKEIAVNLRTSLKDNSYNQAYFSREKASDTEALVGALEIMRAAGIDKSHLLHDVDGSRITDAWDQEHDKA